MAAKGSKTEPIYAPPVTTESLIEEQIERKATQSNPTRVPLPNGKFALVDDLVDLTANVESHAHIFANTEKYLKEPSPGCMYAWVNYKKQGEIMGKVRNGSYRVVDPEEFLDDNSMPLTTHKIGPHAAALVYDVVCVEVQPRAIAGLYKWKEKVAIQKTVRNEAFAALQTKVSQGTNGAVTASMEVKKLND